VLRPIVEARSAHPGDDVISTMAAELERDRVVLHVCEMAFAGTDTTANLIGERRDLPGRASASHGLGGGRRGDPPPPAVRRRRARISTRDLEIGDVTIPAGSRVWLALASASTDDDHLAFGKGRHFCMGAPLARAQARIGLEKLYHRLADLTVEPGTSSTSSACPAHPPAAACRSPGAPERNAP